jgi:hypothetical protein
MTTNIKLFENWIAEEEAVETPPAAATTPTAAPTAATAPKKSYESSGQIAAGKIIKVKITSAVEPFDLTKSTLTIEGAVPQVRFIYATNKWILPLTTEQGGQQNRFNYEQALPIVTQANYDPQAKISLYGIILEALKLLPANPTWGNSTNDDMGKLISAAGRTAYRGSFTIADELSKVPDSSLKRISLNSEVNIDSRTPVLTGNYRYEYGYMTTDGKEKSGNSNINPEVIKSYTSRGITDIPTMIFTSFTSRTDEKPLTKAAEPTIKLLLAKLVTSSQALAVKPIV